MLGFLKRYAQSLAALAVAAASFGYVFCARESWFMDGVAVGSASTLEQKVFDSYLRLRQLEGTGSKDPRIRTLRETEIRIMNGALIGLGAIRFGSTGMPPFYRSIVLDMSSRNYSGFFTGLDGERKQRGWTDPDPQSEASAQGGVDVMKEFGNPYQVLTSSVRSARESQAGKTAD